MKRFSDRHYAQWSSLSTGSSERRVGRVGAARAPSAALVCALSLAGCANSRTDPTWSAAWSSPTTGIHG